MERQKERPSVRPVKTHCSSCNVTSTHHMTNKEIHDNTIIKQWCECCKKTTEWRLTT